MTQPLLLPCPSSCHAPPLATPPPLTPAGHQGPISQDCRLSRPLRQPHRPRVRHCVWSVWDDVPFAGCGGTVERPDSRYNRQHFQGERGEDHTPVGHLCVHIATGGTTGGCSVQIHTRTQPTGRILQSTICICSNTELHTSEGVVS